MLFMRRFFKRIFENLVTIQFLLSCSKLYGILPLKYIPADKNGKRSRNTRTTGKYALCKVGTTLTIVQMCFQCWTCFVVSKYLLESAMMRTEALCSQGNYCPAFGLLLSHTIFSMLTLLIVPMRTRKTVSCMNQAHQIIQDMLQSTSGSDGSMDVGTAAHTTSSDEGIYHFAIIPFIVFIATKMVISSLGFRIKKPEMYYPYNLGYFGPILIINLVAMLCSIGERAYRGINKQLEKLCEDNTVIGNTGLTGVATTVKIRQMMEYHWQVTNFVEYISSCFAVDILLVMIDIYIQLVLFLYVTLWAMFAQKNFSGLIWPHASGLLEVTIIIVKLVYFCYWCDRVTNSGNRTIFCLQHLNSVIPYNTKAQELIRIFTLKVNCREMAITASGFFAINLHLLVRITGVVLTYFLVLIQFQMDGEIALNTTKTQGSCPSWPCLKPYE